jgi:hypothetical protein
MRISSASQKTVIIFSALATTRLSFYWADSHFVRRPNNEIQASSMMIIVGIKASFPAECQELS